MIIEGLLTVVQYLLNILLFIINLPGLDSQTVQTVKDFMARIFDVTESFAGFFIPWGTVQVCLPLLILILNADHIYAFFMWVLRKIPMLGIE